MSKILELVRAEVERRKKDFPKDWIGAPVAAEAYDDILQFIGSLPEDEHPIPADIQEAAEKAALHYDMGTEGMAYQDGYKDGMLAERERLVSCPAINGWVARDENGQVWLYAQRPFRNHAVWTTDKGRYFIRINDTFFPSLRWEDEPREVEIIIRTKH